MKYIFLISVLSTLLFSACSKEETFTRSDLISGKNSEGKSWKTTAIIVGGDETFAIQDDCDKDDIHRFFANGKYEGDEGISKCAEEDPQIYFTGTWELLLEEDKIVLKYGNNDIDTATIVALQKNNFNYTVVNAGISKEYQMVAD